VEREGRSVEERGDGYGGREGTKSGGLPRTMRHPVSDSGAWLGQSYPRKLALLLSQSPQTTCAIASDRRRAKAAVQEDADPGSFSKEGATMLDSNEVYRYPAF
jgi:hypothetical protein